MKLERFISICLVLISICLIAPRYYYHDKYLETLPTKMTNERKCLLDFGRDGAVYSTEPEASLYQRSERNMNIGFIVGMLGLMIIVYRKQQNGK
jgi:hypothetical protein